MAMGMEGLLQRMLVHWAAIQPERPFLIETESGEALTYAQAQNAVRALRRFLGEEPRTIALALPGGIANATIWLAALTGGHTLIPVAPTATEREKSRLGALYAPDMLFVEQVDDAKPFGCNQAQVLEQADCEALIRSADEGAALPPAPCEGSVCLETSGSTGVPKGVVLTERQIAYTAEQICRCHSLSPSDRGLAVLPFFHVNAPVVSLCASLVAGSTVVIAPRFSRSHFWRWVRDYEITWASIVPTILARLLQTRRPAFLPGALRFVRTASAPLPAVHLRRFERRFQIPVIETYGLTEAASQVCANPLPPARHIAGSVGLPVGVALRVCRPRTEEGYQPLEDVAPGEVGELCFCGPSVITGYARGAGQGAFCEDWFRTGDLGYQDADGYVYITGRLREIIIRGGENIAPREIEEVLLACASVREVAVVGRPDEVYGEQVVAFVVVDGAWSDEMAQRLQRHCARYLSAYKIPVAFIAVPALPRTASGKIDRHLLRNEQRASRAAVLDVSVA